MESKMRFFRETGNSKLQTIKHKTQKGSGSCIILNYIIMYKIAFSLIMKNEI